MAKKGGQVSFKDIGNMFENISKKTSIVIDKDRNKTRTYINTGVYILNALLSKSILNGGISKNRITIFAGPNSVGKSYLCYNIARNAQKEGYNIIFIDTEYSSEYEEFENHGIDISEDKFILLRSNKVEEIKITLTQILDNLKTVKLDGGEIPKTIIFLDSIGQLASTKEIEDALEGKNKVDMSRAKAIKSLFRIISSDLGFLDIALVATNHIYLTTDLFPQEKMSGGEGANYSASTIVYLNNAKLKTGDEDDLDLGQTGVIVTAKAKKNRLAKPKKIKFEINHTSGTNPFKGLEFFCTMENFDKVGIAKVKPVVDKSTGEITYEDSATRWYVKHLDKSFFEKDLFTSDIFTKDVLNALEPIISEYFSYASIDEQLQFEKEADNLDEIILDEESEPIDEDDKKKTKKKK